MPSPALLISEGHDSLEHCLFRFTHELLSDTAYIYELTKEKQPEAPTPPATGQDTADPTTVTPKVCRARRARQATIKEAVLP